MTARRMQPCELCQARPPRTKTPPAGWVCTTVRIGATDWAQWHKPTCPAAPTLPTPTREENP